MKIKIKLKKPLHIDLLVALKGIIDVTDVVKISDHIATCHIPQEPVAPGGKIDAIFDYFGGISFVKSITLTK